MRFPFAAALLVCTVACSSWPRSMLDPASVVAAPQSWPAPHKAAPDAPPEIQRVWLNETTILPGSTWTGRVITSTNVASVEIRTESFSFAADRSTYGDFRFEQRVLDMVAPYRRAYTLSIIARNAAGDSAVERVPISFR